MSLPQAPLHPEDTGLVSAGGQVDEYISAAVAARTREAYQRDLNRFLAWGGQLPSSAAEIAQYLSGHAHSHRIATLQRWRVSIGRAHTAQGLADPSRCELVRTVLRGISREHGCAQRRATPVLRDEVMAMVKALGSTPKEVRDRALVLVGFAGALRRSELVGLMVNDVQIGREGLTLRLRRSKTDQEQKGREIGIPYAQGPICPVQALQAWQRLIEACDAQHHPQWSDDQRPIFRGVNRHGHIACQALSDRAVNQVIKARCRAIGLDAEAYSGHSLRAGFCTSAAQAGKPSWQIRKQTGHKSEVMLNHYIRAGRLFADNALNGLW